VRFVLYSIAEVAPIAAVYMLAMWFSNASIGYVSYPVQTLGKSCKMIPVMLGQVVFDKVQHPLYKYACVLLMVVGVAMFNLSRMSKKKLAVAVEDDESEDAWTKEAIGMGLLLMSLLCDSYTGPNQDRVLKTYKGTDRQLMAMQNLAGAVVAIGMMAFTPEFLEGPMYVINHPSVLRAMLLFSAASAFGQLFVFAMLYYFDSLLLTTVTTVRKFTTIVLSDIMYKHGLSPVQWASVGLVFLSIVYDKIIAKFVPPPFGGKKSKQPGSGKTTVHPHTEADHGAAEAEHVDNGSAQADSGLRKRAVPTA